MAKKQTNENELVPLYEGTAPVGSVEKPEAFTNLKKREKVAIVGFAESSYNLAPFNDDSFEIWGLNELYMRIPRWDRWFQLHNREVFVDDFSDRDHDHVGYLQKMTCPIYMCAEYPDIPNSVRFPLEDMVRHFTFCSEIEQCENERQTPCLNCPKLDHYFTNSISYMIALAIYEGYKEIHIYGVDMAQDTEYGSQKPSCELFVGWARGAGIKVFIPTQSDLVKAYYFYGFEKEPAIRTKYRLKKEELNKRLGDHTNNINQIDQQINQLQQQRNMQQRYMDHLTGGVQLCDYFLKNFS